MSDKQQIIKAIVPKAVLKALTQAAKDAIAHCAIVDDMVSIRQYPFNIGRESRVQMIGKSLEVMERRKFDDSKPNNDLYLLDRGRMLNISREHLLIEKDKDSYLLVDRGSACGTGVNDVRIGGHDKGGTGELKDGDIIAIGAKDTPYRYEFIVLDDT